MAKFTGKMDKQGRPLMSDGTVVVDEKCGCGHLKSEHRATLRPGHGSCLRCPCTQYRFKTFIFERPKA
jgi:hypothetical protein